MILFIEPDSFLPVIQSNRFVEVEILDLIKRHDLVKNFEKKGMFCGKTEQHGKWPLHFVL